MAIRNELDKHIKNLTDDECLWLLDIVSRVDDYLSKDKKHN